MTNSAGHNCETSGERGFEHFTSPAAGAALGTTAIIATAAAAFFYNIGGLQWLFALGVASTTVALAHIGLQGQAAILLLRDHNWPLAFISAVICIVSLIALYLLALRHSAGGHLLFVGAVLVAVYAYKLPDTTGGELDHRQLPHRSRRRTPRATEPHPTARRRRYDNSVRSHPVLGLRRRDTSNIFSTKAIESINARYRRGHQGSRAFPDRAGRAQNSCLGHRSLDPTGRGKARWAMRHEASAQRVRNHLRRPDHPDR